MYAQSADILDVCHVHAAAFLYVCSELSYVIPPGARQLKEKNRNYSKKKQRSVERGKTPRGGGYSTRRAHVFACAHLYVGGSPTPRAASPWLKPAALRTRARLRQRARPPRPLSPRCSSKNTKSWNLDCINPHEPRTWNIQAGNVEKQVTLLQIFRLYTTQHSTPLLRFQLCWLYINNAVCFDKIDKFQSRGRVQLMGSRTHHRPVWYVFELEFRVVEPSVGHWMRSLWWDTKTRYFFWKKNDWWGCCLHMRSPRKGK